MGLSAYRRRLYHILEKSYSDKFNAIFHRVLQHCERKKQNEKTKAKTKEPEIDAHFNGCFHRHTGCHRDSDEKRRRGIVVVILFCRHFGVYADNYEKVAERGGKKRAEIERERKVLYYGTAIIRGVGGSLFLTDCALEFYPLNQYKSYSGELIIPLNKIKAIQSAKSKIFVYTAENDMYFVIGVTDNAEWEKQIAAVLPENACNE